MVKIGILLAAGKSRRFGADKLDVRLDGQPLVAHAAAAMAGALLDHRVVVGRELDGFVSVAADGLQSDSLKAALRWHDGWVPNVVVITLGDMPLVDSHLIDAVVTACPTAGASAAFDGRAMPPACFAQAMFPALAALEGDRGAGALLKGLPAECLIPAQGLLVDIDTPDDLDLLRAVETTRPSSNG